MRRLFVFALLLAPIAQAAEIDVAELVKERVLQGSSKTKQNVDARNQDCLQRGWPASLGPCATVGIQDIRLYPVTVTYSEVKTAPIPNEIVRESEVFYNCTPDKKDEKGSVVVETEEGLTVTTLDSITKKGDANISFVVSGLTLGRAENVEVKFDKTQVQNARKTITRTTNIDRIVNPWTALVVIAERRVASAYLDFEGVIEIEASVFDMWGHKLIPEPSPAVKLSTVVDDRRFSVRGQIWNASSISGATHYLEIPLDDSSAVACNKSKLDKVSPFLE